MSAQTRTILISATVVAAIYVVAEFYVKPRVGSWAGIKVK